MVEIDFPSTWVKFKPALCEGCFAGCCTLPVEVNAADLLRLGLVGEDEITGSLKKVARRLIKEGWVASFRARTGLFTLAEVRGGCVFLDTQRRCTVYEKRPDVCRKFPLEVGPRVGFCPAQKRT
jgi:Fe-S-cluster containining protein